MRLHLALKRPECPCTTCALPSHKQQAISLFTSSIPSTGIRYLDNSIQPQKRPRNGSPPLVYSSFYAAHILKGSTMQGVDGHTNDLFKTLNLGPFGPATYSASPKIDGSPGGWSSPHCPLKSSHATGISGLDGVNTFVPTS